MIRAPHLNMFESISNLIIYHLSKVYTGLNLIYTVYIYFFFLGFSFFVFKKVFKSVSQLKVLSSAS